MINEIQVGPRAIGDGATIVARGGRTGETIVSQLHPRLYETASRGSVYAGMTAVTGTTIVAANNSPVAAAAATILSLYNPLNSRVNLAVFKTYLSIVSGTPAAGAFVYNVAFMQNITATMNNGGTSGAAPQATGSGQSGAGKVYTQTALTGGTGAQALLQPMGGSAFAGAIAAGFNYNFIDQVDGSIVLPPGGLLTLASPGTGTTVVVAAGFVWEEVPLAGV